MSLTWYEYVIARNVARGTYDGEPPVEFKNDVYDASMRLGVATRTSMRQAGWIYGLVFLFIAGITFWIARGDIRDSLIVFAVVAGFVAIGGVVGLSIVWFLSRTPAARLGRRIEDAMDLPADARWEALLQIARDEAASTAVA